MQIVFYFLFWAFCFGYVLKKLTILISLEIRLTFCDLHALTIASQGKFATAPTVLVTAEHISAAFKHDAASLWVENATSSSFYICLRELQNYDGLHEDIFVVVWLLSFFWGMHIKNRREKEHMTKRFNETYVKEKIIYVKKRNFTL